MSPINDGLILSTDDGGSTWVHRTQGTAASDGSYLRFPAPWYFLSLFLVGLLVWRRPKVDEAPPEESVADVLVSDRPLEEATGDVLAVAALKIWHPLVFARQCTPRATKRFMNFVRYLAMRQRRQSDRQPPIKQFLARLKERLAGVRPTEEVVADVVDAESGIQQIPDEVLVALAALQHLNPECLSDQPGPVSSPDKVWPRAMSATNPLKPLFDKAKQDHEAKFGNWATVSQYRKRFLEMTANVQVR